MDKYARWKNAVEGKGLRMTVDKTKGTLLLFGKNISISKVDPFGVCGERVGCNVRGGFIVVVLMCLGR